MNAENAIKSREAVRRAVRYLRVCGIAVPRFRLTSGSEGRSLPLGGSYVTTDRNGRPHLHIGTFPTGFIRDWFAMHELGHVLWACHRPLRWKRFREEFGEPRPPDTEYDAIHRRWSGVTVATGPLSMRSGPHRPKGEPSCYGARGGGEERFCELLALMYANGDFSQPPPGDLAGLWDCCWTHGLSRMT